MKAKPSIFRIVLILFAMVTPLQLIASCAYPNRDLGYRVEVQPEESGFRLAVQLHQPLTPSLPHAARSRRRN